MRRTCRISSSYEAISANHGHAAITRPVAVGSATATFVARLAAQPSANSAHGSIPPRTGRLAGAQFPSAAVYALPTARTNRPLDRAAAAGKTLEG
jgi:hypothetical protein